MHVVTAIRGGAEPRRCSCGYVGRQGHLSDIDLSLTAWRRHSSKERTAPPQSRREAMSFLWYVAATGEILGALLAVAALWLYIADKIEQRRWHL
jgi:polyferredoxin